LPLLSGNPDQELIDSYADRAYMSVDEVDSRISSGRSLARSFFAERVRTSSSQDWGVLVYDSIDPREIIRPDNRTGHLVGIHCLALVIEE
jgi:hypothetical protein